MVVIDHSFLSMSSPSHLFSLEKKHWWLRTKKMVDKYIREARVMMSTQDQSELNSALSQLEAALSLSPRYELALELKARCLLYLRRYKEIADMLQDYIPSYKMAYSDDSSGSSSDNSSQSLSRERVKLLKSPNKYDDNGDSEFDSPSCDFSSLKCFSVSDLKKKVLPCLSKSCDKEGQWRYVVLGQACCHLGLMEDAIILLQHGKRLATAAFRRESIHWTDDSFISSLSEPIMTTTVATTVFHQPLTESELITHFIASIKLLMRRRAAAVAALDAGLYLEAIRHFSKILDGRRPAPQAFLAECFLNRSTAFKSLGRVAESIADLNRALALDTNSTTALELRSNLYEQIGCITDAVHDLEHVKLIYNSVLRDRKLPGPAWKPRPVPYREIPGRLCALSSRIQQLKQRIAKGETGNVDYYALIGLRRGCSRSELDRAHLLLILRHKPEKSIGFMDRCEFIDEKDIDSVKDRARMSAVLLYRLIQKGYSFLVNAINDEEGKRTNLAHPLAQAQVQNLEPKPEPEPKMDREPKLDNIVNEPEDRSEPGLVGSFAYQGVFCRDLAAVGSLLSQVGFNRQLAVKYEALTC